MSATATSPPADRARRGFLRGLITTLLTIAIAALVLEVALRVVFARSMDFGLEMWKYARELKRSVDDPELSFVHAPGGSAFLMGAEVTISSQGLRDRDFAVPAPAGTYRILFLGDSTAFGWGVAQDQTVPKALERLLQTSAGATTPGANPGANPGAPSAAGPQFEVLNAGVGNYTTVQEVAYYRTRGRAFRPDLVILMYFINDAEPVPRESQAFLIGDSYLAAFVSSSLDGLLRSAGARADWHTYYASLYDDAQPGWRAAKDALVTLARETRADGAKLLVAILPELRRLEGDYPFAAEHAKVKAVLAGEGVPVIELLDGLRGHGPESTLWVTPSDPHPNAKACGLVAQQLRDRIAGNR